MTAQKKSTSSSPDRAFYEDIKRKNPRAALFWLAGDRLYHAGLVMIMICLPVIFFAYTKEATEYMIWLYMGLALSVILFFGGIFFKRESYKTAMKAGMDITKYL
ncbi:MAG: hypothetical protein LBV07_01155 [Syntrophobacterales bacterium]|nr:hypothetical protein [Syntrophobacterales bacterium]